MHVGSQISRLEPYEHGLERAARAARRDRAPTARSRSRVSRYRRRARRDRTTPSSRSTSTDSRAIVVAGVRATGLELIVEPGRFLVGNAGVLLTRVLYRKRSGGKEFIITDAGMNDLLRPSHYNAFHRIEAVRADRRDATASMSSGRCARAATFSRSTARWTTSSPAICSRCSRRGAYGFVMASNYNSRPRAAEVLVDGDRFARGHRARELRGPRAARSARARVEDGLMLVGLLADTHDRVPAIAELVRADAGARASAWCCTPATTARRSALAPFHRAQHRRLLGVFGRNDGDHEGLQARMPRREWEPSSSSRRTASRSAGSASCSCTTSAKSTQRSIEAHEIVVHGFTHRQEMKTRGDTLIVNPGEACGWLHGTPHGGDPRPRHEEVEFISSDGASVEGVTMHEPDPDPRLRLAVHAAHRAPGARGARVLRDPSADAYRRLDPRVEADGNHPERRAELRVRRRTFRRADPGAPRHRARARHLLRHAAHRAPRRAAR